MFAMSVSNSLCCFVADRTNALCSTSHYCLFHVGISAPTAVCCGANRMKNGKEVAVKQLRIGSIADEDVRRFCSEIKMTSLLDHPNICTFYGNHPVLRRLAL